MNNHAQSSVIPGLPEPSADSHSHRDLSLYKYWFSLSWSHRRKTFKLMLNQLCRVLLNKHALLLHHALCVCGRQTHTHTHTVTLLNYLEWLVWLDLEVRKSGQTWSELDKVPQINTIDFFSGSTVLFCRESGHFWTQPNWQRKEAWLTHRNPCLIYTFTVNQPLAIVNGNHGNGGYHHGNQSCFSLSSLLFYDRGYSVLFDV